MGAVREPRCVRYGSLISGLIQHHLPLSWAMAPNYPRLGILGTVEMREELGFHVYLKLSIYTSEVASAKHVNQCKACKLVIHHVRPEPRTFNRYTF